MVHDDDNPPNAGDKIHGTTHTLDHLSRDHPVGEVTIGSDFHGAQNGQVDMPAPDHGETVSRREIGGFR